MIKAKFKFDGKYIQKFEILGHSNLSNYGNDIVCAAVSATCLMTINGILEILKLECNYEIKEGYALFEYKDYSESANTLLNSFYIFLEEIQKQYPNRLKLKLMEV